MVLLDRVTLLDTRVPKVFFDFFPLEASPSVDFSGEVAFSVSVFVFPVAVAMHTTCFFFGFSVSVFVFPVAVATHTTCFFCGVLFEEEEPYPSSSADLASSGFSADGDSPMTSSSCAFSTVFWDELPSSETSFIP